MLCHQTDRLKHAFGRICRPKFIAEASTHITMDKCENANGFITVAIESQTQKFGNNYTVI